MKALKILIFALVFMLSFSACGSKKEETSAEDMKAQSSSEIEFAEKIEEENTKQSENTDSVKSEEGSEKKSDNSEENEVNKQNQSESNINSEKTSETNTNDDQKFYYATDATGDLNITYHTKGCSLIEGKQAMEINSDFVTMIGLRRCEKCNPPELKK